MTDFNVALYAGSSIVSNYKTLLGSGFTTVILNSLHVHDDGSLWLNDTEVVGAGGSAQPLATELQGIISALRGGGIKTVLVSVGGGGAFPPSSKGINGEHSVSDSDFKAFSANYWSANGMTSNLASSGPGAIPVLANVETFIQTIGADGLDLDPEPTFYSYADMLSATVTLTKWALSKNKLATWVPYTAQPSWQAYAQALAADPGAGAPSWVNVQWWWTGADLEGWAKAIGVPIGSIVGGFMETPPASIQTTLAQAVNGGTAITGAYYWNFDDIASDPAPVAQAIIAGLSGKSAPDSPPVRPAGRFGVRR